jgi:hypothetical protein
MNTKKQKHYKQSKTTQQNMRNTPKLKKQTETLQIMKFPKN